MVPKNSKSQSVLWHQKCETVIFKKISIITSQTAETRGACGKPFRPSLTISPHHRPVMTTHPSQMHSTTFIHGLKCRITHLQKNCPHLPTSRRSVCLQLHSDKKMYSLISLWIKASAKCINVNVRKTLSRINPRKAAGTDNIPGRVLKDCAEQLTDVLTDIFNTSLSQAVIPKCLKSTTIIPVPNKSLLSCLNDYCPIALTPIIMKCFARLVMHNFKTSLPNTLDLLQFAYRPNRSTDDAISSTLHLALTHLENKDSYVRILFINFSSAFNTIILQQLIKKLNLLGPLYSSLCNWILDFLTGRPQSVRVGHNTSSTRLCAQPAALHVADPRQIQLRQADPRQVQLQPHHQVC